MCLLAYSSTHNTFFMDYPVSFFVFHSSLLASKCVNLVVARDGFLCMCNGNRLYFFLDYRGDFKLRFDSFWCVMSGELLTNKHNGYFNLQMTIYRHSTCKWGAQLHVIFLVVAASITEVLFVQFLICLLCA